MKRCPITYLNCDAGRYSKEGLNLLSPLLHTIQDFPYGLDKQYQLLLDFSDKLSFSGIQPKLSAKLDIKKQLFEVVRSGTYLLKLPNNRFPELPQNEDLSMKLAAVSGIPTPKHGMIYATDNSLIYFIERFDRLSRKRFHVEDFGQLAGLPTDAKYDFSMEKIAMLIDQFCTFPELEKEKLFRMVLFNFLIGNEDMHVKNFSLINKEDVIELTPAYDLVNSTIVMTKTKEEIALPMRGKKSKLNPSDFFEYFGIERLSLPATKVDEVKMALQTSYPKWLNLIEISFLSDSLKEAYLDLLKNRYKRLFQN